MTSLLVILGLAIICVLWGNWKIAYYKGYKNGFAKCAIVMGKNYICKCNALINKGDSYCWYCGEKTVVKEIDK